MAQESRREKRVINGEEVEVILYPDGLVKRADNGYFLEAPRDKRIHTSERGRELNARRYALAREQAARGLAKGLGIDLTRASGGEAWGEATRILAEQFSKSKNLRGMAEAYIQLGRATGFLSGEKLDPENDSSELAAALVAFLRSKIPADAEVIDGEVKDE